ncbi:glycine--tRNA ligase subunit beta [Novosphingobium sp.]|uniref:glycine--tRNA ligase subunit beta n=1 Tax=Novosphingobium sp. TaxID=1874826 RepID=UPI0025D8E445|nr:glycine--tRNA ligase subunit beta [Novosphingobium sp.]
MSDFLLELRSEEIPARMQAAARETLEKLFRKEMDNAGIALDEVTVWSTPRRLALIVRGLPKATAAVNEEIKGPREGAPPQALEGFLRKTGLAESDLSARDGVLYAVIEKPGRPVADVLAEAIPAIIRAFTWPKSQRWGAASIASDSLRWVRPLSAIVAILGDQLIECEVGGVRSGFVTRGHRFHCPGEITIGGAGDYAEKLRAGHVIVDHAERQDLIRAGSARAAAAAGLVMVEDEGLVIENAGLTEWPIPLLGRFDQTYLDVPPEVIKLTARTNQKYFVCNDAAGKLANAFICTANIAASDGGAEIVAGNRKVLAARLSDARFFWEQDRKVPLAQQADKLERITFHEKLGTVADKVERVATLVEWLASEGIVPGCDPALARQAAQLCKADLVTEMVGEFPELQGLMGGYYARAEGLPDAVADAIRDHYKPVGQGDDVPTAPVTVAVSLADKLDTLARFFAAGMPPTGSKDPFALRRAGLGFLSLIVSNLLRVSFRKLLLETGAASDFATLEDFLIDRLKVQQREAGVRHDLIDAVFALGGEDDLVRLLARVHALQAFVGTEDGTNLLAGYKRAANILKKEGVESTEAIPLSYTPEPAEKALIEALGAAGPRAAEAVAAEDFAGAMAALATLRAPIDRFFDEVTVNDADPAKRLYRLSLLAQLRDAVHGVADFSRIEG